MLSWQNCKIVVQNEKQIPLVWLILIVSCCPFLILSLFGINAISGWFMPDSLQTLIQPASIWRLWSPVFVHYTLAHLLTNLALWWLFAGKIERESKGQLLVVFFLISAISNMAQWWFTGPKFGGLSGVTYGLMSYLALLNLIYGKKNYHVDPVLILLMLALIPLSFSGILGKLSNYAHLAGLLTGLLLALGYAYVNKLERLK